MDVLRQITVKNGQNLPISNPKPDLHNINAHTKFGENPLIFTRVVIWSYNINLHDRHTWRSGVRSAMHAASQLSGRGPTDVDVAPVPAC